MKKMANTLSRKALTIFASAIFVLEITTYLWCAQSDYYGTYAGTFSSDDSGYWVAVISTNPSNTVFLSYSTVSNTGDGGYLHFQSEFGGVGRYYSSSVMNHTDIYADIVSWNHSVSGNWSGDSLSGTLSGNEVTSSPYEGTYSGTFSGDTSGTWSMTVKSNGYVTGSMTTGSETSPCQGGVHPQGYIIAIGEDANGYAFSVFGRIAFSSVSGSWESEPGSNGTFSGTKSDDGDGGGGSGSGCFISSMMQ